MQNEAINVTNATPAAAAVLFERKPLLAALAFLAGPGAASIVEARNTIPIVSCVTIEAVEGGARLSGTDLDIFASTTVPAAWDAPGTFMANGRDLLDAVKACDGDTVRLSDVGAAIAVQGDSIASRVPLFTSDDDAPCVKPLKADAVALTLPAATLAHDLERVRPCVSSEETRYYLNGILFHTPRGPDGAPTALCMAATDGHRLAKVTRDAPADAIPDAIVPRKVLDAMMKALGKKPAGHVVMTFDKARVDVRVGDWLLEAKLIDGAFPDYGRVIPTHNDKPATFTAAALAKAASGVAKAASTEKTRAVKLELGQDGARVSCSSVDRGTSAASVAASWGEPDAFEIGMNGAYLATMMGAFAGDVTLTFADASAPILVTSSDAPELRMVLMPMRVGGEVAPATRAAAIQPVKSAGDVFEADYGAAFVARDGAAMLAALDTFKASDEWARIIAGGCGAAAAERAHDQLALRCARARLNALQGVLATNKWTKALGRRFTRENARIKRASLRDASNVIVPRSRSYPGVTPSFAILNEAPRRAAAFAATLAAIPGYDPADTRDVVPVETNDGKRRYVNRAMLESQAQSTVHFVKSDGSYGRSYREGSRAAIKRIVPAKVARKAAEAPVEAPPVASEEVGELRGMVQALLDRVASLEAAAQERATAPEPVDAPTVAPEPETGAGGAGDGRDALIVALIAERDAALAERDDARAALAAVPAVDARRSRTAKRMASLRRDVAFRARNQAALASELKAARSELRRLAPVAAAIVAMQASPPAPPAMIVPDAAAA